MQVLSEQERQTLCCDICGNKLKSERGLKIHYSTVHKNVDSLNESISVEDPPVEDLVQKNAEVSVQEVKEKVVKQESVSLATLGVTEILVGSKISLSGPHYKLKSDGGLEVCQADCSGVVVNRWLDNTSYYLMIQCEDSYWVLQELIVLHNLVGFSNLGSAKLIELGSKVVPAGYVAATEEPSVVQEEPVAQVVQQSVVEQQIVQEPVQELVVENKEASLEQISEVVNPEEEERKTEFLQKLHTYVCARDAKAEAEKLYKAVDAEVRPCIIKYLEDFGKAPEGEVSKRFEGGGFKVVWSCSKPEPIVKRDEQAIVTFLVGSPYAACLKYSLDLEKWEALKATGVLTQEFIDSVEKIEYPKPIRKLFVDKE